MKPFTTGWTLLRRKERRHIILEPMGQMEKTLHTKEIGIGKEVHAKLDQYFRTVTQKDLAFAVKKLNQ